MRFTPFGFFGSYTRDIINVPIGTVIPIANTAAWTLPTAGQVVNGWTLCNGQTFASLGAAGVNYHASFSGSLPNISDDRFILGGTTIGTTGGSATVTLVAANIPLTTSGNDSVTHDHSRGSGSTTGETAAHAHSWSSGVEDRDHNHNHYVGANSSGGGYSFQPLNWSGLGSQWTSYVSADHTHSGTSGGNDRSHTHSVSFNTGGVSVNHTHTYTNASQTAFTNVPSYIKCVYVMRVL